MNKYVMKQPVEALLWCNNVGDMMSFIATVETDVKVDMNVKEHGYGVANLTLNTAKGSYPVRESVDYVVKGADGEVYVIEKTLFDANFKLDYPDELATVRLDDENRKFDTQPHKI